MNRDNSEIRYHESGSISMTGDAVTMYAAYTLVSALRLYVKHKMRASRFHTPKLMLIAAERYTGKTYNHRKPGDLQRALDDVKVWADNLKAALPKTDEKGEAIP